MTYSGFSLNTSRPKRHGALCSTANAAVSNPPTMDITKSFHHLPKITTTPKKNKFLSTKPDFERYCVDFEGSWDHGKVWDFHGKVWDFHGKVCNFHAWTTLGPRTPPAVKSFFFRIFRFVSECFPFDPICRPFGQKCKPGWHMSSHSTGYELSNGLVQVHILFLESWCCKMSDTWSGNAIKPISPPCPVCSQLWIRHEYDMSHSWPWPLSVKPIIKHGLKATSITLTPKENFHLLQLCMGPPGQRLGLIESETGSCGSWDAGNHCMRMFQVRGHVWNPRQIYSASSYI